MNRVLALAVLVAAASGQPAGAANPDDIQFQVRLIGDTSSFHLGQPIALELSYASDSDRKYLISQSNPTREFGAIELSLEPTEGALDPRMLRPCWGGIGGSHASSWPQYLGSQPITEGAALTDWYRFQKSGLYSLTVTSREVSRPEGSEKGSSQEQVTLESNTVEFEILPRDPAWEASELRTRLRELEDAKEPFERAKPSAQLALLDTQESARKLAELYLSSAGPERYWYGLGLTQSSQLFVVIPLLEAALSDPEVSPSGVPELLAQLQVRKEMGVFRPVPEDGEDQEKWQAECQDHRKSYDRALAKANELLLARLAVHSGSQRSAAIYEAWQNTENRYAQNGETSEILTKLRLAVLDVAEGLTPDQLLQFVHSEWNVLPREQLRPLIRKVASGGRWDAYQLWCEGWPAECSAAILAEALKPDTQIWQSTILQMVESERPELDSVFRAQLSDAASLQSSVRSSQTSALVLRVASRELKPSVTDALTRLAANRSHSCETEAYLLGYLFRFAVEEAQRWLSQSLQDEQCGGQLLRTLNVAHYSDALVPVALKALDSSNLNAAGTAAVFLGDHGSTAAESALWQRLEALWALWRQRSDESRAEKIDDRPRSQWANLEQSLASALSHATNWKLTASEVNRLHDGCMTQQCRDIADGKMWLGL